MIGTIVAPRPGRSERLVLSSRPGPAPETFIAGAARELISLAQTALTKPGKALREFARSIEKGQQLDMLHDVKTALHEKMKFEVGQTNALTTAEDAFTAGHGVCQDHSHAFIAVARLLGCPARYVSGYLHMEDTEEQVASHAWAEAYIESLGWVGFDPANDKSPDENYVHVAHGFDYADAAPVSGIKWGPGNESLTVSITVEQ